MPVWAIDVVRMQILRAAALQSKIRYLRLDHDKALFAEHDATRETQPFDLRFSASGPDHSTIKVQRIVPTRLATAQ
jgi:hypothetical protein